MSASSSTSTKTFVVMCFVLRPPLVRSGRLPPPHITRLNRRPRAIGGAVLRRDSGVGEKRSAERRRHPSIFSQYKNMRLRMSSSALINPLSSALCAEPWATPRCEPGYPARGHSAHVEGPTDRSPFTVRRTASAGTAGSDPTAHVDSCTARPNREVTRLSTPPKVGSSGFDVTVQGTPGAPALSSSCMPSMPVTSMRRTRRASAPPSQGAYAPTRMHDGRGTPTRRPCRRGSSPAQARHRRR